MFTWKHVAQHYIPSFTRPHTPRRDKEKIEEQIQQMLNEEMNSICDDCAKKLGGGGGGRLCVYYRN